MNGDDQVFVLDHLYRMRTATAPASYGSLGYEHDAAGNLMRNGPTTFDHDVPGFPHRISRDSDGRTCNYDLNGNLEWVNGPTGHRSRVS